MKFDLVNDSPSPRKSENVCASHHLDYPQPENGSSPAISLSHLASCGRFDIRRTNLYIIKKTQQHRQETITEELLSSHSLPCNSGEIERGENSLIAYSLSISGVSETVTALILAAAGISVVAVITLMWIKMFKSKYYTSLINKTQAIERSDIINKV